jgi:hypothetical protein
LSSASPDTVDDTSIASYPLSMELPKTPWRIVRPLRFAIGALMLFSALAMITRLPALLAQAGRGETILVACIVGLPVLLGAVWVYSAIERRARSA